MKYYKNMKIIDATAINLDDRYRKDLGKKEMKDLAESLASVGQIHPIVMEGEELRAGGRRVWATLMLLAEGRSINGLEPGQILAINSKDKLEPLERLLIELEENRQRKGFNKAEEALLISALKVAFEEAEGKKIAKGRIAQMLGYSKGQISMALTVADAVTKEGRTELKKEASIAGAYRKLKANKKLEALMDRAEQREKIEGTVDFSKVLHCGDAMKWFKDVKDESIDFVNFDPPWGIGIDSYDRHHNYGTFNDDAETGILLARSLIPEIYRVLREDTYAIVWFGIQFYQFLYETLEESGFKVHPVPLVWFKTNKSGSQNDPSQTILNVWEPAFLVSKGDPRIFAQGRTNVLSYPMVREGRLHFAQKDVDMQVDILERFTFTNMVVLDPTFGSGSFFIAAKRLGRDFVGCERDPENYQKAVDWLRRS
jgi:site-specific DNA-methyltransferase (adenine-specific)